MGKIAVIGPYGSRKREVCTFLSSHLKCNNIPHSYIDVISALQKQGLEFDEKTTYKKQETIFRFQQAFECMKELNMETGEIKYALFDKSIMDIYLFTKAKFPDEAALFYPKVEDWINRHPYHHLYMPERLENNKPKTDEKIRFQHELHQGLEILLRELGIMYSLIPKTFFQESHGERVRKFNGYFGKLIK